MYDDLPDWISEKIGEPDPGHDLQAHTVARIFCESDDAYLTRKQVQAKLPKQYDRVTVNRRLGELVEVDVLKSREHSMGNLYWLYDERSEWPIPPDVPVGTKRNEPTVSEFFDTQSVQVSVYGIAFIVISSASTWFGGLSAGFDLFSQQTSTILVAIGLLLAVFGWGLFGAGVYQYVRYDM